MLFKNNTSSMSLGSIRINEMNNILIKYKYLENSNSENKIEITSQKIQLKELLLEIKYSSILLFARIS